MRRFLYIALVSMLASQCRDRYEYLAPTPPTGFLVVEGIVNTTDSSSIRLMRSTTLAEKSIVEESGATVQVEGEDGSLHQFIPRDCGYYVSEKFPVNSNGKYRLHIITRSGREYASDYRLPVASQPIDSISFQYENDGLQFYVNSIVDKPQKYYFKYDYEETWEFDASFRSNLVVSSTGEGPDKQYTLDYYDPIDHSINYSIFTCWQSNKSRNINIGTTENLTIAKIFLPIRFLKRNAWELSKRYSLLVKQYGLSAEGYDFYRRMKKNSGSLGSIFDAQPSQITGNIRCVSDSSETVVGFVEFSSAQQMRIFDDRQHLPGQGYDPECNVFRGQNIPYDYPFFLNPVILKYVIDTLRLMPTVPERTNPFTFRAETPRCVDCTLRGTNVKPSFWP